MYPITQLQVSLATQAPCTHGGSQTTIKEVNRIVINNNLLHTSYTIIYPEASYSQYTDASLFFATLYKFEIFEIQILPVCNTILSECSTYASPILCMEEYKIKDFIVISCSYTYVLNMESEPARRL